MHSAAHRNWDWDSSEQEGTSHWAAPNRPVSLLDRHEWECSEDDQAPELPSEFGFEQLPIMISDRLEQALELRKLEEQLAALRSQLDLAIEAYRLVASTESMASFSRTWQGYLVSLLVQGPLSQDQVLRAVSLWEALRGAVDDLTTPHAAALEDGTFSMAWDKERYHFEVELQPCGLFNWFYMNRSTDQIEGEQDLVIGYLSESMINLLRKSSL